MGKKSRIQLASPTMSDDDRLKKLIETLPSGKVAILSSESARYTIFHASLNSLILPQDSRFDYLQGCYVVDSSNNAVRRMLPHEDWVMFMGDDHVFPPHMLLNLLVKMYQRDLDVIVPLCFRRSFPPSPVVFKITGRDEEKDRDILSPINLDDYPDGGIIEADAIGSAGMIVRRRVFEAIKPPWFRLGGDKQEGEDIYFSRMVKEAGFRIHVDLGVGLGHIVNATIWPKRTPDGWGVEYDFNLMGGFFMPMKALEDGVLTNANQGNVEAVPVSKEEVLKGIVDG